MLLHPDSARSRFPVLNARAQRERLQVYAVTDKLILGPLHHLPSKVWVLLKVKVSDLFLAMRRVSPQDIIRDRTGYVLYPQ